MTERLPISTNPVQRAHRFPDIPYSDEALEANLQRLENAWEGISTDPGSRSCIWVSHGSF